MDLSNHPCFNDKVRHKFGRIHLPVAPRCNVQCNFCNRQFDCVNESRPGVASVILSPQEALNYVDKVFESKKNISVVGIAGPGDPFANPDETMETLRLVREKYPDVLLCVSTNGLNLLPYIDELAKMNLSHMTITINAIDPEIIAKIYSWMRYGKRIKRAEDGAQILLDNQLKAIKKLKENGIMVKINSIIIPGINDHHIVEVAKTVSGLKADILNCIPLYNNPGTKFENIPEPTKESVARIRLEAGKYINQMHHCTRCRADAVGLLGENLTNEDIGRLRDSKKGTVSKPGKGRPNIAVATNEGMLINQHLGEARELYIYSNVEDIPTLVEIRKVPPIGLGDKRWYELAEIIKDCSYVLVSGAGNNPKKILKEKGIEVLMFECVIDEALKRVFSGGNINYLLKRDIKCGQSCTGTATGCG